MLQVEGLTCERDQRFLFTDLCFVVQPGEIVQVAGANGTGKTTLLKILMGLYTDFAGSVVWNTQRPPLYLSHKAGVKDALTVAENLSWLCQLQDHQLTQTQLDTALNLTGLRHYADVPCGSLSEGQRKRVNLTRFYLLENSCWVMDEPFSSLDAEFVTLFEGLLQRHIEDRGTVIVTSHQAIKVDAPVTRLELFS